MEMSNFESPEKNDGGEHEEKFDSDDSWDQHIAQIGKGLSDREDSELIPEDFDNGVSFVAGRQYMDDERKEEEPFGAWNPGKGDWIVEKPEKVEEFDENLLNGVYRAQLEFCAVGQPDGPATPGHIWAVRLRDQKEDKEIPGTRVFSNKLSHGVTEALSKTPKWAREIWKTKKEILKERLIVESKRTDHYFSYYSKPPFFEKVKLELEDQYPLYKEIVKVGSAEAWVELQQKKGIEVEQIIRTLIKVRHELVDFLHKKSLEEAGLFPGDEIGGDEPEGDGWLPPPQWK